MPSKNSQLRGIPPSEYAKIGHDIIRGQQINNRWEIDGLDKLKVIDPASYFATNGEAVEKANQLVKDAYSLAQYCSALLRKLRKTRADADYLETKRDAGKLLVRRVYKKGRSEDE